jgi:benzoyl-CoA-dihydrodiol lyase
VHPTSRFREAVGKRASELAAGSDRPQSAAGITLHPLKPTISDTAIDYRYVSVRFERERRVADLTVRTPQGEQPSTPDAIRDAADHYWPLRAFRELDDVLLRLRLNEPEIGTIVVRTEGHVEDVLAVDRVLAAHMDDWLVREIVLLMKRTLKRMDLTARSFFALIEPGSAFGGSLFELALAADRSYMLDDPERPNAIALSAMNAGPLPMSNGLSRLQTRLLGKPELVAELLEESEPFDAAAASDAGLVTFAPDELDWDDEVRLAIEARAALSPDAMTGLEANLRFAGPETLETKIFGRLTAWQNWIFQRPNAVGDRGALKNYGNSGARPEFDWRRT